jgi:two-component system, cell cycle response regulator
LAHEEDDFSPAHDDGERTAVVNLADLRAAKRTKHDRHLLVRVKGSHLGRITRLDDKACTLGRHQDCEVSVRDDGVSRRHAKIELKDGKYVVEDLSSANGTFVQGQKIERHVLRDGDLIQLGPTSVFRYSIADEDQQTLLEQLYAASVTDSLTGAHNREYFDQLLATELSYAKRHRTQVALVLFDLDHFKLVNDTHGHPAGDAVLIAIAQSVRKVLRAEDILARYGGEEFAVVLRGIDLPGARSMAERLRVCIAELEVTHEDKLLKITASLGCAALDDSTEPKPELLIATADRRLYAAKRLGRNRVVGEDTEA